MYSVSVNIYFSTSQTGMMTQSDDDYSGTEYSIDETEATTQSDYDGNGSSVDESEVSSDIISFKYILSVFLTLLKNAYNKCKTVMWMTGCYVDRSASLSIPKIILNPKLMLSLLK